MWPCVIIVINSHVTVYHYNDIRSTVTRWSFNNVQHHVTAFRPISEAAQSWSYDNCLWYLCNAYTCNRHKVTHYVCPLIFITNLTYLTFLHLRQSIASSLINLRGWQSFSTTSPGPFGLPLSLGPSTSYSIHFFTKSSSSFHNTCPHHHSLFCCNTNVMWKTGSI